MWNNKSIRGIGGSGSQCVLTPLHRITTKQQTVAPKLGGIRGSGSHSVLTPLHRITTKQQTVAPELVNGLELSINKRPLTYL